MKNSFSGAMLFMAFAFFISCQSQKTIPAGRQSDWLLQCNHYLNDVIMVDIFSPPVASRIYAYSNVAAYEATVPGYKNYHSFSGKLNQLNLTIHPNKESVINYPLAGVIAFCDVAKKLVYSEEKLDALKKQYQDSATAIGLSKEVIDESTQWGDSVAKQIIAWSKQDMFSKTRSMPRYTLLNTPGAWVPTPPEYADAIEPNWGLIRPMTMDSANEFVPSAPVVFDSVKGSAFYALATQVMDTTKNMSEDQIALTKYWDDNALVQIADGHMMHYDKKTTPGGHWINIACLCCRTKNFDEIKTAQTMAATSIALFDAFISCWKEKYVVSTIRPVTFINKYIDRNWTPLLQTPPFPEYPSGHSTISASASTVLEFFTGENFSFTDSSQVEYNLPVRSFHSLDEASNEASISRVFGGIHFLPACVNGRTLGKQVGRHVIEKLLTASH